MKNTLTGVGIALALSGFAAIALASSTYNQTITLESGWSVISTPRILDSHTFSAAQISANFDIYVLDASQPSGWATMATLGQTEFIPLYGYFINNKTGTTQTLTLNYKDGIAPNQRLFERTFIEPGWYSFGAANPTYAIKQCQEATDNENVFDVLYSLNGQYDSFIDFTADEYLSNPSSVTVGTSWMNVNSNHFDQIHDLRDTKGYAFYLTWGGDYRGFQNLDDPNSCPPPTPTPTPTPIGDLELKLSEDTVSNPDSTSVEVDDESGENHVLLVAGNLKATGSDFTISEMHASVAFSSTLEDQVNNFTLEIDGDEVDSVDAADVVDGRLIFSDIDDKEVSEGDTVSVRIFADVNGTDDAGQGETLQVTLHNGATVTDDQNGDSVDVSNLPGSVSGGILAFYSEGILAEVTSIDEFVTNDGDGQDTGTFTFKFKVTAFGSDAYIVSSASCNNIYFSLEGSESGYACTLSSSADESPSDHWLINDGDNETFTVTIAVTGDDDFVKVHLDGLDYTTDETSDTLDLSNLNEWESDAKYLNTP